ncbi:MAG TPA: glycosyltransferase family 9 protein [Candidatus Dormibacteraeota bacterium]|nr:glycosyltransferase family 9 protein [Candidatus Dormibacteraeota bacterium]
MAPVNVAVLVSGGIAETILATPLLATLRAGDPEGQHTLLCPHSAGVIADGLPGATTVVPLRALDGRLTLGGAARAWLELRRRRLEAVAVCPPSVPALLAAFCSGIPQRVSNARGVERVLCSATAASPITENVARSWIRLAGLLGIRGEQHRPHFDPGEQAAQQADWLLGSSALADGRLLIAIAPGSGFAEHRTGVQLDWEPERYAHVANQLAIRHGAGIALVGSPADRGMIERVKLDLGAEVIDLSTASDPRTLAALLARCDLLVGGDTPLLHLAAAVGTPTVGLFGRTDGVRLGPYGPDHRIIQALGTRMDGHVAAEAASMDQIRVEDVLASIESTF